MHKYTHILPADACLLTGRTIMAGPCSAESREQVLTTAEQIARRGMADIYRAGVWKPRTHPGCFEGIGVPALEWLAEARIVTGLPVATEVAVPGHVAAAAEVGIDVLWIGARTCANPFAVQELADAIASYCPQTPVLVKNPVSPDLELWIGALQRLQRAGVAHLGAIHRGFSVYKSAPYRNAPIWQLPLELHRRFPSLPLLHDPSHTGGSRDHIAVLSQQALDMGFTGLMIECHTDPSSALSDGGQQLTPDSLFNMLSALKVRSGDVPDRILQGLRGQIDDIDNQLLGLLARRMELSDSIGECKRRADMPVVQTERYSRLLTSLVGRGVELGLDEAFLAGLLERIHAESVRRQLEIVSH